MDPGKVKAIEVKIDLSKQIFGAAITLMGFQSALFLFVLEKKEGTWYFYLATFIAFTCLILSLVYSGFGIDNQTAKLEGKEIEKAPAIEEEANKKTKKKEIHSNYKYGQPILAFSFLF